MRRLIALAVIAASFLVIHPAHAAGNPDYAATSLTGEATVVGSQTFTRTFTITNLGQGGGTWPVSATINQVEHATYVSTSFVGFQRCAISKYASGALNFVRCYNAYLQPGQSATMTVTYRAAPCSVIDTAYGPVYGAWCGWVYTGGGYVTKTSMESDPNTANNYIYGSASTTIIYG